MSDQSPEPLKLVVLFNDSFPEDVLKLLGQSAKKIILDHFRDGLVKDNAKKPYAYPPQDSFDSHILHLAKKAFDNHSLVGGYPGDDVQQIMSKIDNMAEISLKGDYGAHATAHLHPIVIFTPVK